MGKNKKKTKAAVNGATETETKEENETTEETPAEESTPESTEGASDAKDEDVKDTTEELKTNNGAEDTNGDADDEGGDNLGEDDDDAKNDEDEDSAPAIKPAAPQAQESMDEMEDCKLSPLDADFQRQSLRDALEGKVEDIPTPTLASAVNAAKSAVASVKSSINNHIKFSDSTKEQKSSLHADEYSNYQDQLHNPNNHESALQADDESDPRGKANAILSKFRRKKEHNRPIPGSGTKAHSHPRKSPFRSEVARLRQQQRLEKEKKGTDPEGTGVPKVGIAVTTAPPDSASFVKQTVKLKHNLLNSIGEFLTSAFADDEEASGSYFSQDLLEQISRSDPSIEGVWLQAKSLNDNHVQQLCESLIRNKVVTEVWLQSNQITDVGAAHIAHMLKFNKSIKELFLGENQIGPKGAAALASALARGNSTLVALGLGDNHIGVEGAGAFAAALRHNHNLYTLDIKNNDIPGKSSIRGLLHKMLEFNASDPGDESLVMGLQEELCSLVTNLPSDMAESVVMQAEEALKMAMLCRKRGDIVGAAEAEGIFIRICTTGEAPQDPPEELANAVREHQKHQPPKIKKKKSSGSGKKKQSEPDRLDELNEELSKLTHDRDASAEGEQSIEDMKPEEGKENAPAEESEEENTPVEGEKSNDKADAEETPPPAAADGTTEKKESGDEEEK